jgi:hypothetical protein
MYIKYMSKTDNSEVQHMNAYPKVSEHATGSENGKYEGSSKSFRTFIFLWEMVRVGVVVIGRV